MKTQKPSSPTHCLQILNENMKTSIILLIHKQMHIKKEQKDKKSPLKMLAESVEQVLGIFQHSNMFEVVSHNPLNIHSKHNFKAEDAYKHDIKLLNSQLKYLKESLAELDDLDMIDSATTSEQIKIAMQIDKRVKELEKRGCDEVEILMEMTPFMANFKKLLDTVEEQAMDELCERFEGFYHYARLLEHLAGGIRSGEIKVP